MKSCVFLSLLLLPLSGCSHRPPAAGGAGPPVAMEYRDFADVQGQSNLGAPLRIETRRTGGGGSMTSFVVAAPWHGFAPGQTFRDGVHIAADVAAHKGSAAKLKVELRAWNLLLKDSPVILSQADLEPECHAEMSSGSNATVVLSQTFTPAGSQKFAQFTQAHTGEIVGIIVDGRILSAPLIREPVSDGRSEISGGFDSLNEARVLAARLNEAAGR